MPAVITVSTRPSAGPVAELAAILRTMTPSTTTRTAITPTLTHTQPARTTSNHNAFSTIDAATHQPIARCRSAVRWAGSHCQTV